VMAKKCTKKRDARAELLFCQSTLNESFDVLVAVAVVRTTKFRFKLIIPVIRK